MKKLILSLLVLVVIAFAGFITYRMITPTPAQPAPVACTMEAKLCPDGSYVGRSGPLCEFAACPTSTSTPPVGTGDKGILPYHSGIHGVVMLGPTCPVMRIPPDPGCADKPYQTMVAIFHASDPVHAFIITHSAADGTFSASMPPGDYTLGAGESNLPRCDHPSVTVSPGIYATTTISCDTGIR